MSRKKIIKAASPPDPQLSLGLNNPQVLSLREHLLTIQEYQETGRAVAALNYLGWVIRNLHAL